jgi:hypothetical protein
MHVPHITGNINMLFQYLKYALQSAIKVTELYIGKELSPLACVNEGYTRRRHLILMPHVIQPLN